MGTKGRRRPACGTGAAQNVVSQRLDAATVAHAGRGRKALDFAAINAAALAHLPALCARWLPDGRREGNDDEC